MCFLPLPGPFGKGRGETFSPPDLHSLLCCFPHPQLMWLPFMQTAAAAAAVCFPLLLFEGMVKTMKSKGSRSRQKFRTGKKNCSWLGEKKWTCLFPSDLTQPLFHMAIL